MSFLNSFFLRVTARRPVNSQSNVHSGKTGGLYFGTKFYSKTSRLYLETTCLRKERLLL